MMQRKTIHQAGNRDGVSGLFLILCILAALNPSESHAWLIFHKPEYRGKIIDAETKKPLEGVVVVAIYSTSDVIGGPGGPSSREIGAREALTDENGIFVIPSYTAIMNPIARENGTQFIIFKAAENLAENLGSGLETSFFVSAPAAGTRRLRTKGMSRNHHRMLSVAKRCNASPLSTPNPVRQGGLELSPMRVNATCFYRC